MKRLLLLLVFLSLNAAAFPQEYSYRHYTILDGLVQNQVTSLYQDQRGFIWVGTKGGASRFDGVHFKNYTAADGLPQGLVLGFLELKNDLYCYCTDGISVFRNGQFRVLHKFPKPELSRIRLAPDSSRACIVMSHQLFITDTGGMRSILSIPPDISFNDAGFDPESGKLIFAATDGLYRMDNEKQFARIITTRINTFLWNQHDLYFNVPYYLDEIGDGAGIYALRNGMPVKIYDAGPKPQMGLLKLAGNGKIVCFTSNSQWIRIDTSGRVVDRDSLNNVIFTGFLCDKEGNYWLASETGLYTTQSFAFRNYGEKSGLPPYVWSIFETADSAIVFAGYEGAIGSLKNNKVSVLPKVTYRWMPGEKFYMNGFCNSRGEWMLPMVDGQVLTSNGKTFSRLILNADQFRPAILCAYEDTSEHQVYFGTTHGLYLYNLDSRTFTQHSTEDRTVLFVEEDPMHRKWVCTNAKIYLYEKDSLRAMSLPGMEPQTGAVSCKCDPKGNMWLACKDGLYLYTWDQKRKIVSDRYFFLSIYRNRFLIAGTITGFLYIDLEAFYQSKPGCARFFDRFNGFTGIECGQNGTCIDSRGNVWIPASDRVVQFIPERIVENHQPPLTFITSMETASGNLNWRQVMDEYSINDRVIELSPSNRNVRFRFHGISLSCPEKVMYKTRLTGFDEDWSKPSATTEAVYTNLSPGDYQFEFMARNSDGIWGAEPSVLNFRVLPKFWQTGWFIGLAVIVLILSGTGLFYFLLKRRRKKEQQQRRVEKELVSLQLNTINAQIDPHFIFNTLTAIGSDIQENHPDRAYAYFVKVSNLLRNSITGGQEITRTLKDELDFVENYLVLQKYRFGEKLSYNIYVEKGVNPDMKVPKMCIQIFVENAVKHGLENKPEGGSIQIRLRSDEGMLTVEIEDNGIGREVSKKLASHSTGKGLVVFEQFFALLNKFNDHPSGFSIQDLYNDRQFPVGTMVILSIPLDFRYQF